MPASKDLFDDSTMSFGDHLEVLRVHLFRALIGLFVCVIVCLLPFVGGNVVKLIQSPLDAALRRHGVKVTTSHEQDAEAINEFDIVEWAKSLFSDESTENEGTNTPETPAPPVVESESSSTITVSIKARDLSRALQEVDPNLTTDIADNDDREIEFALKANEFADLKETVETVASPKPVTLTVQEAFMTYLKVAFVTGFVFASPWVFYQLWLFVAAGLYPHERKYVYIYLPMTLTLFFGGAIFCFFAVFPFVLDFLFGFNQAMGVEPNIRLSEWISFAIMLPVMFGLSFQLPLVMMFLERISIFEVETYREKRRMAILIIAIVSMMMTPADPMSMLMMMIPMLGLYELGIVMCRFSPANKSPFEEAAAQ